jgi:hypothetical protein
VHADDGIVIVGTVVDDQSIFGSFLLWSSGSHIGNVVDSLYCTYYSENDKNGQSL